MSSLPAPDRLQWLREAKFGMFIHWGLFALHAGRRDGQPVAGHSEWLMLRAKVPPSEYRRLAENFNPVEFDATAWVETARLAGMKYMIVVTKHHDGFAIFDSAASDWNIVAATPFGRDPLRELAQACHAVGMPLGFYYSHAQDWMQGGSAYGGLWHPDQPRDFDAYLDNIAIPQIRELLTGYGPSPAVLWWDTPADMTEERAARIDAAVRALRPDILTNDRLGPGFPGDIETPEQFVPKSRPSRPWETCMTMNESWGFKADDHDWKSSSVLLRQLCQTIGNGGNYLLNVGPTAAGLIPPESTERLAEIGQWVAAHPEAIYGAGAGPLARMPTWGACSASLANPRKLYWTVFDWPENGLLTLPIFNSDASAYFLAAPENRLPLLPSCDGLAVALPSRPPGPLATVIVTELDSDPVPLALPEVPPLVPAPDGSIHLGASDAEIFGTRLALFATAFANLGNWCQAKDYAVWKLSLPQAGKFSVTLEYAVPAHRVGSTVAVEAAGQSLAIRPEATPDWEQYRLVEMGSLALPSGVVSVTLRAAEMTGNAVMNVRSLQLRPI